MVKKDIVVYLGILLSCLTGCAFEINHNVKLCARLPATAAIEQIPLRIGVYYGPEFLEQTARRPIQTCGPGERPTVFFIFPVGGTSQRFFDQTLSSMFASVTPVAAIPQPESPLTAVDGVLEPRIVEFRWGRLCRKGLWVMNPPTANITYAVSLYDARGSLVTVMHLDGSGVSTRLDLFDECKCAEVEHAMQEAMAKLMIEFPGQEAVKQWLANHGSAPGDRP